MHSQIVWTERGNEERTPVRAPNIISSCMLKPHVPWPTLVLVYTLKDYSCSLIQGIMFLMQALKNWGKHSTAIATGPEGKLAN